MGEAEDAVARFVDRMPLLQKPFEERRLVFTPGTPLDFYGAGDGKLHANGAEFHIKGINWCVHACCNTLHPYMLYYSPRAHSPV